VKLRLSERLRIEHILLVLVACFVLVPFIWIIAAGFKTQISLLQGEIFFTPNLASYREVLFSKTTEFFSNSFNSLIIATASTLAIVFAATLGGYAMERMETPRWMVHTLLGWSVVFHMVPPITLVAAWFPLYRQFHLDNTYTGMIFAHTALHLPMALWLMSSFIREVPIELEEAARIDGCSTPYLLWKIIVPLIPRSCGHRHPDVHLQLERVCRGAEHDRQADRHGAGGDCQVCTELRDQIRRNGSHGGAGADPRVAVPALGPALHR